MSKITPVPTAKDLEESIYRKFSKKINPGKKTLGLELELLPVQNSDSLTKQLVEISNEQESGSFDIILKNSKKQGSFFKLDKSVKIPRFLTINGGTITFEPGGQLEFSSRSSSAMKDIIRDVSQAIHALYSLFINTDISFFQGALNPWDTIEDVGLKMKKSRYLAMDKYFESIGPYGQQMMRLTTSLQINLDFGDRETGDVRWHVANLISPMFCAIFGNSPFSAGMKTNAKSFRSIIWQNLDKSRTGFPFAVNSRGKLLDPVKQYLEFALTANVIFLPDGPGNRGYQRGNFTFSQWLRSGYNGYYPNMEDWELHLTTLFPEVRPKGFMECRFIDGQAKAWWPVPAIFLSAVLYDHNALEKTLALLSEYSSVLDEMTSSAAREGVKAFPELILRFARIGLEAINSGFDRDIFAYCERFFEQYTYKSENPADDLLNLNGGSIFTCSRYKDYEEELIDLAEPPDTIMY